MKDRNTEDKLARSRSICATAEAYFEGEKQKLKASSKSCWDSARFRLNFFLIFCLACGVSATYVFTSELKSAHDWNNRVRTQSFPYLYELQFQACSQQDSSSFKSDQSPCCNPKNDESLETLYYKFQGHNKLRPLTGLMTCILASIGVVVLTSATLFVNFRDRSDKIAKMRSKLFYLGAGNALCYALTSYFVDFTYFGESTTETEGPPSGICGALGDPDLESCLSPLGACTLFPNLQFVHRMALFNGLCSFFNIYTTKEMWA